MLKNELLLLKRIRSVILTNNVAQYPLTDACIQYVVMIHLSEQVRLTEL